MKKTYKVEVLEILSRMVEVRADTPDDAVSKVEKMYRGEEIVLDYADLMITEIAALELPLLTRIDVPAYSMYIHKITAGD